VGIAGLIKNNEIKNILEEKCVFYPTTSIPSYIQPDTNVFYFPKSFFGMIILNNAGNIITVNHGTRNTDGYYTLLAYKVLNNTLNNGKNFK